jgi:F-type H+-transporting ATPase subunit delta
MQRPQVWDSRAAEKLDYGEILRSLGLYARFDWMASLKLAPLVMIVQRSVQVMREIRIAKPYAQALFDAATEGQVLDRIIDDAHRILELATAAPELDQFIRNPIISPQAKGEIFQQLLSEAIHPLSLNFLLLLASKQRDRWLVAILQEFLNIVDAKEGRLSAQVISATPLTDAQQASLIQQLSAHSGKQVRLESTIDPGIKGGFIARLGDTVFDGSVATQLQRMKELLARG